MTASRESTALSDRQPAVVVPADDGIAVEWSEPLPQQLWAVPFRWMLLGSTVAGGVVIAVGWVSVSASRTASDQIGGLVAAVVGLGLAAVGQAVWIISGRRSLGRGMANVLPAPDRPAEEHHLDRVSAADDGRLIVVQGGVGLYHRPGCPFTGGKSVTTGDRQSHEQAGRSACAVCEP